MRKIALFILLTFPCFKGQSQNLTIINAYYTRAQNEYTQKKYDQAIYFLEKATESLGTEINPEVTYLLAKSHYHYDLNVLKAQQLFLKFINEAKSSNPKNEEVSELIHKIQTFDGIDSLCYFKDVAGRNGVKKTYFSNDTLQKKQIFKNGLLEGAYQEYFENGTLFKEGFYKNGGLNGELKTYHTNGNIMLVTNYYDSEKHGVEEKYNINGMLTEQTSYTLNSKNGSFKTFFEDGKKTKEEGSYKNNALVGIYKKYYENGNLELSCMYGEGSLEDGPEIKYYEDGSIQWVKNYQKGKLRGIQKYFYDNKQLSEWDVYNDEGNKHGENKEYFRNGKLAINILYDNGRVIDVIEQKNAEGENVNKSKLKHRPYGTGHIIKIHDNNKISFFANYTDGLLDGKIREYFDNSHLKCEGYYNYGSRDGQFKYYYSDGILKSKVNYRSNDDLGFKDGEYTEYYETGELKIKTVYQYNKEIEKNTYYKNGKKSAEYNYLNEAWEYFPETE